MEDLQQASAESGGDGESKTSSSFPERFRPLDANDPSRQSVRSYFQQRRKEVRKQVGLPVSPDEKEELEEGVTLLYKLFDRRVTLHPGNVVMKTGNPLRVQEADALRIARENGLPVPRVLEVGETKGRKFIRMDYVEGETLQALWPGMSILEKKDLAKQLGRIVDSMRQIPPLPDVVGACDGREIHDLRTFMTYDAPACKDEAGFNDYLLGAMGDGTPRALHDAFKGRLKTSHRIVLSHCDLAPRNIIVKNGKIAGLIDWENAGWYPEYWEYVKFFQRCAADARDWGDYADAIFSEEYTDELVVYRAISTCQAP